MNRPRVSIARLMVAISVLALNGGLIRALIVAEEIEVLVGIALMVILVQVGLALAIRGRARPFWSAFVVAGLLAVSTLLFGHGESVKRYPGGKVVVTPATVNYRLWGEYLERADDALRRVGLPEMVAARRRKPSPVDLGLICGRFAIVCTLPQLVFASSVGMLVASLVRIASGPEAPRKVETFDADPGPLGPPKLGLKTF